MGARKASEFCANPCALSMPVRGHVGDSAGAGKARFFLLPLPLASWHGLCFILYTAGENFPAPGKKLYRETGRPAGGKREEASPGPHKPAWLEEIS